MFYTECKTECNDYTHQELDGSSTINDSSFFHHRHSQKEVITEHTVHMECLILQQKSVLLKSVIQTFSINKNRTPFGSYWYKGNSNVDETGFSSNLQWQALVLSKGLQNHVTKKIFSSGTLASMVYIKRSMITKKDII